MSQLDDAFHPSPPHDGRVIITMTLVLVLMPIFLAHVPGTQQKDSHHFLLHVLINLNMFLSTPLKIKFRDLEFPRALSSSVLYHLASGFKIDVSS